MEKKHETRSHLILDDESRLVAYFSLSFKEVIIPTGFSPASKSEDKKLGHCQSNPRRIRAILLAQLGRDDRVSDELNFDSLQDRFIETAKRAQDEIGGRILLAECESKKCGECSDPDNCADCEKLLKLYLNKGFNYIKSVEAVSTQKTMHQIYCPLWIKVQT